MSQKTKKILHYSKEQTDSRFGEFELGNWIADVTARTIVYLVLFDNTIFRVSMTGEQLKVAIEQGITDGVSRLQVSGIKIKYDSSKSSYVKAVTYYNEKWYYLYKNRFY